MPTPLHLTAAHFAIFTPYRAEKNRTKRVRNKAISHKQGAQSRNIRLWQRGGIACLMGYRKECAAPMRGELPKSLPNCPSLPHAGGYNRALCK
jgi:hypothetical protein